MSADQPRDWDKEMAEIDRIIAGTPPARLGAGEPAAKGKAPAAPAASGRPAAAPSRAVGRREGLATWARVGLGALLGAGMTQWPYAHACGTPLFLYLGAVGVVGLTGLWGMVASWRSRMGTAHVVSLLVLGWGAALAAAAVLPRIGYARAAALWFCP